MRWYHWVFLAGLVFGGLESWYFGWNARPESAAEVWCDVVAIAITYTGIVGMLWFGERHARATVAAWRRERAESLEREAAGWNIANSSLGALNASIDAVVAASGVVKHTDIEECAAAGCGCMGLSLGEIVVVLRERAEKAEAEIADLKSQISKLRGGSAISETARQGGREQGGEAGERA